MDEGVDGAGFGCELAVVPHGHGPRDCVCVRESERERSRERRTVGCVAVPFAAGVDEEDLRREGSLVAGKGPVVAAVVEGRCAGRGGDDGQVGLVDRAVCVWRVSE